MNTFWQFLNEQYPESFISNDRYWNVGSTDTNVDQDCTISALSQYGFLAITGPDGSKFLQGQTTCDWRNVDVDNATLGSYCNIKGRMVISFLGGTLKNEEILLRLHADTADSGCETLAKYIVFSKAKIKNATDEYVAFGISGKKAKELLLEQLGMAPTAAMKQVTNGQVIIVQLDDDGERFECWATAETATELWRQLGTTATTIDSTHWEAQNIQAGLGEIRASTQDTFIPQMLNYQLIGGVSFTKGCYTGQEVVARMQYRGKLKRRLYRAKLPLNGSFPYSAGADIFSDNSSQSVGNLVSASHSAQEINLLAVITEEAVALNKLHFANDSTHLLIEDLPYLSTASE